MIAEEPYCSQCGNETDSYTMLECWSCGPGSLQCPDCNSEFGFLCSHYQSDWEG